MDAHLVGRDAGDMGHYLLVGRWRLRACPQLDAVCADPYHSVERLHRSVREVWELVDGFDDLRRAAQGTRGVADLLRGLSRAGGQGAIRGIELFGAPPFSAALVPHHAQRLASLSRGPKTGRDDAA